MSPRSGRKTRGNLRPSIELEVSLPSDYVQILRRHVARGRGADVSEVVSQLLEAALESPSPRDRLLAEELLRSRLAELEAQDRRERAVS